jgi:hypothetical protein
MDKALAGTSADDIVVMMINQKYHYNTEIID